MESFTPAFFLQILIAIGTAGAVYGAIKADLKNMHFRMTEEREERIKHETEDNAVHTDIRNKLGEVSTQVARVEGAVNLNEKLITALQRRE